MHYIIHIQIWFSNESFTKQKLYLISLISLINNFTTPIFFLSLYMFHICHSSCYITHRFFSFFLLLIYYSLTIDRQLIVIHFFKESNQNNCTFIGYLKVNSKL